MSSRKGPAAAPAGGSDDNVATLNAKIDKLMEAVEALRAGSVADLRRAVAILEADHSLINNYITAMAKKAAVDIYKHYDDDLRDILTRDEADALVEILNAVQVDSARREQKKLAATPKKTRKK